MTTPTVRDPVLASITAEIIADLKARDRKPSKLTPEEQDRLVAYRLRRGEAHGPRPALYTGW